MNKNMGMLDRMIRLMIAGTIATLYILGYLSGTLGIVLLVFAGIFLLTSLISFCPLYLPFGIKTTKKKH